MTNETPENTSVDADAFTASEATTVAPPAHVDAASPVAAPAASAPAEITFADLNLAGPILRAVTDSGYTKPTPIQAQAIPIVLSGLDVMAARKPAPAKPPRSRCRS